jgi:PAS domain S-box-containing protein
MTEAVEQSVIPAGVKEDVNERIAFLESILESATLHAIVAEDLSGTILCWNAGAQRIYGYDAEEIVGKQNSCALHIPEDVASGCIDMLVNTARQTGIAEGSFQRVRKNGERFTASVTVTLRRDLNGTPIGLLSISQDITEEQRLQEQLRRKNEELEEHNRRAEESNRLKTEFLDNMSHELRTPLNSIIGFAELLFDGKAGATTASQHEFLGDILSSGRHLLQLINDTVDLVKVESGRMYFFPELVNLNAIADEVCNLLGSLAAQKQIHIRRDVDPSLSGIVIDPAKLMQLLYNFLSSVLKFTPDAGHVILRMKPDDNDRFTIEVEETGIAVSTYDIRCLFQDFEQLSASTAHKYHGMGVSLALAKRIVEAQGGEVGVRSTPGQGSIFWARLARTFNPVAELAPSIRSGPAVLVIEHDPKDRAWLIAVLSEGGYQSISAVTGAEALENVSKRAFDLITLDILLPDMAGVQLFQAIRKSELNCNTPVIAVTLAEGSPSAAFPVYDWLVKPVARERLLKAVKDAHLQAASPCILVVDDDPSSLKLARYALTAEGYRVLCVSEGEEALRLLETEHPVAIVLDLVRNGIDGFELLRRLPRKVTRRIPVIIWSGKSLTPEERDWLLRTANKIVPKGDGGTKEIIDALKAAHVGSISRQH